MIVLINSQDPSITATTTTTFISNIPLDNANVHQSFLKLHSTLKCVVLVKQRCVLLLVVIAGL